MFGPDGVDRIHAFESAEHMQGGFLRHLELTRVDSFPITLELPSNRLNRQHADGDHAGMASSASLYSTEHHARSWTLSVTPQDTVIDLRRMVAAANGNLADMWLTTGTGFVLQDATTMKQMNAEVGCGADVRRDRAGETVAHPTTSALIVAMSRPTEREQQATSSLRTAVKDCDAVAAAAALDAGADARGIGPGNLCAPVLRAAFLGAVDMVSLLVERGATPNASTGGTLLGLDRGTTPLLAAVSEGHVETARLLLYLGADPNIATSDTGETPLLRAASDGDAEMTGALLELSTPKLQVDLWRHNAKLHLDRHTPLTAASAAGHVEVVELLLRHGVTVGRVTGARCTALHQASQGGHLGVVKQLLTHGANLNEVDADHMTPLQLAVADPQHSDVVEVLLRHGANPSTGPAGGGFCPLHDACDIGAVASAQLLAAYGADPTAMVQLPDEDDDGVIYTPLSLAIDFGHAHGIDFIEKIQHWPALKTAVACRNTAAIRCVPHLLAWAASLLCTVVEPGFQH